MKLSIVKESFIPGKIFFEKILKDFADNENEDIIIDESHHGIKRQQIVPFLYLHKNSVEEITGGMKNPKVKIVSADLKIEDVIAYPLVGFKIFSLKNSLIFYLESFDNPIGVEYKPIDSDYYHFFTCKRENIIAFKRKGDVDFLGVKAKKSLEIAYNARYGARGLIGRAIFKGITNVATNSEDDLEILKGELFELKYKEQETVKTILIVADVSYKESFNLFLEKNWSGNTPEKIKTKEGCFIATACYNDYNHPIVYQLRDFRDYYLKEKKWGRKFIILYYKHSPHFAKLIESNNFLKYFFKISLIKPLYYFTKIIKVKK